MNFTPVLSAFQGTILSANNVHEFAKLTAKGGNADQIDYVIKSILRFLEESQFIIDGKIPSSAASDVQRFALYIVLNSDLPELQNLIEMDEISTVIWTTPTIPKCLMCELMWNLHMQKFIFEIISYTKPQLALEVASAFLENFKYFDPHECLGQLELLSTACYLLICQLHNFNFQPAELLSKSTAAFNNFQRSLSYYTTPPNNHKLFPLKSVELYKYQGKCLYSLLHLIDKCLAYFENKLDTKPAGLDIYKLTYAEDTLNKDMNSLSVNTSSSNVLQECLNNANIAMLDTCKVLVMDVSVDVFCCWSEFEENGKSMQQTIGELCYIVYEKLLKFKALSEHPFIQMIEQIARKPVEMKDTINITQDEIIIENINNNNDESKIWIKALVHKENLCHNKNLLDIVNSKLNIYNEEDSYCLYSIFNKYVAADEENRDYVESLSVKVFQKCETSKKYVILEERFSNKILIDMKETPEFGSAMTSVFNRLISSPDADLTDVLILFLQSPQKVYSKIFILAIENIQQTQLMLKVMKLFEKFSDHYYGMEIESCIIRIVHKIFDKHINTQSQQNNFVKFICGLKNSKIIPSTKLLLLIIMPNMHKALVNKDISKLSVQIQLLCEAYDLEELMEYRAPMLAMLAQVLDVVRWKINTFNVRSSATLESTLELQSRIMTTYNGVISDNESYWLKSKIRNLQPLNMYYYRMLWNPPGSNYLDVVSGKSINKDMNTEELTSWLSQIISSCTQQEWCEMWDSLKSLEKASVLKIFHDAVAMLTLAEKANRTENSWACILHCYRNLIYITRYKYFTEPLDDNQVCTVVRTLATLTEMVKVEDMEEFGTVLLPLFAYLTEKQNNYSINFAEFLTEHLSHTGISAMINKVFVNGTG